MKATVRRTCRSTCPAIWVTDFRGYYPSQFLRQDFLPEVPVFHLVGGLDLLRRERGDG